MTHLRGYTGDGTPIEEARFDLPDLGTRAIESWCPPRTALHLAGPDDDQRLMLFRRDRSGWSIAALDISGATPTVAWNTADADGPELPGQVVSGAVGGDDGGESPLLAAATDEELLVVLFDDDALTLTGLDLDSGEVVRQVALPVVDLDGEARVPTSRTGAQVLVAGDRAVVSISDRGVTQGRLYGIDLTSTASAPTWIRNLTSEGGVTISGPGVLALSGTNVLAESLSGLHAVDLATGAEEPWSGEPAVNRSSLVTGADGGIFLATPPDAGAQDLVHYSSDARRQWQLRRTTLLGEAADPQVAPLSAATITGDGTLVVRIGGLLVAIDDSGGLADCVLPFDDVTATNVHAENICRLVQLNITGGTSPTTYGPTEQVTRAQMASFLARSLGLDPIADAGDDAFPDVDPANVHAANINAIRAAGITQGRGDGTYDPSGTVTRAEMASFLARSAGLAGVPDGTGFTDVDANNVHTPNIYAVRDAGITTGVTATTFDPSRDVRRDQMASFLIRLLDYLDEQA